MGHTVNVGRVPTATTKNDSERRVALRRPLYPRVPLSGQVSVPHCSAPGLEVKCSAPVEENCFLPATGVKRSRPGSCGVEVRFARKPLPGSLGRVQTQLGSRPPKSSWIAGDRVCWGEWGVASKSSPTQGGLKRGHPKPGSEGKPKEGMRCALVSCSQKEMVN